MTTPIRLRADAARNRANILRAARELIAARGKRVGMDDIAQEAGVAVGTLYRHFPTKTDLVEAIVDELATRIFDSLDQTVARIEAGASAVAELAGLIERTFEAVGHDRAVKAALSNLGIQVQPELPERARNSLARIITAGHAEGRLRPDVRAEDLVILMSTMPGDDLPLPARQRWLELIMRTLTVDDASGAGHGPDASHGPGVNHGQDANHGPGANHKQGAGQG